MGVDDRFLNELMARAHPEGLANEWGGLLQIQRRQLAGPLVDQGACFVPP